MSDFALAQFPLTPWRNGRGETREIAKGTLGRGSVGTSGIHAWDWRLSVASLKDDGSFSTFAGVDRIAVLVEGAVTLTSDVQVLSWKVPGDLHGFLGDEAFRARVHDAPVRLLNLMTRRASTRALVVVHRENFTIAPSGAEKVFLVVLHGVFEVLASSSAKRLDADHGLLLNSPREEVKVALRGASGCLVEMRVHLQREN